jgi:hypothetical protein
MVRPGISKDRCLAIGVLFCDLAGDLQEIVFAPSAGGLSMPFSSNNLVL